MVPEAISDVSLAAVPVVLTDRLMWSFNLLISLVLLALNTNASEDWQPIGYKDCSWESLMNTLNIQSSLTEYFTESKFNILDVQAAGCYLKDTPNGKKLCEFKEGSTPRIRIKFIPDETVDKLKTQIKAKIGQTFLEFPMADADACTYGVQCPVEAGKEYVYEKGIEIISNYPKDETVQVNWMVKEEKNDGKAVCIIFLARIVA
ncbi:unnamed protein product [Strongylus vulgaris]|uniref:MD-2-related lipid-recognition domain-containing protein n=1 Tax=Strongylus vulgaris TaxID=40348 RepID=A0A3P7J1S8_STRVU|nr:unnamed protein product [Strongylus vulgaris]